MRKYLNFICPTDHIESVIHDSISGEHYFFSSLGNSMTFDQDMVGQIRDFLEVNHIREISFVLSDDNRIVSDALKKQTYSKLEDLHHFYKQIIKDKKYSESFWQTYHPQFLISSYHLSNKIKELRLELNERRMGELIIGAKIYKRQEGIFRDIYSDLILRDYISLN